MDMHTRVRQQCKYHSMALSDPSTIFAYQPSLLGAACPLGGAMHEIAILGKH